MSATSRWRSATTRRGRPCLVFDQARRMRGAGRRIRLRKIRQRAVDPEAAALSDAPRIPPAASASRAASCSTLSEREMREIRGNDISIIFQEPMTSLNPLHTIEAQIGEILLLHSGISGADGAGADARTADAGRHSRSGNPAAELSASIVRRPAPARHDRDGARQRAGSADRGRADHRARRHRAGADPGAAGRDPRAARHEPAVHHPRSRHRPPHRRRRLRHEQRQDRRAGAGRAGLHRAEASLYARAARGRAEARSGAAAARMRRW